MPTIREMAEGDLAELYALALRAFKPDFEQYGHYPPLLDLDQARLRPGVESGFTVLLEDRIIGGVFAWQRLARATLGAVFLDPDFQGRGLGRAVMRLVEERFPKAERWTLETPYQSYRNHRFYEQSGYVKIREEKPDPNDDFTLFIYEKRLPAPRPEPADEERAGHG